MGVAFAGAAIMVALLVAAPAATAATEPVNMLFTAFAPGQTNVLTGDTVEWHNVSQRRHTVTADDGTFDSGDVLGDGRFARRFEATGTYAYRCTVHPGMTGRVTVSPVTLAPLPTTPVRGGSVVEFAGRTADHSGPVVIERVTAGPENQVIATATPTPTPDGAWKVGARVRRTGHYRATSPAGSSPTQRLIVSTRRVLVRPTGGGVAVRVSPPLPHARVLLQLHLRKRFGWWPVARARLDGHSRATFRVRRRSRARVLLVGRDGWTPRATSRVVRIRRRRAV